MVRFVSEAPLPASGGEGYQGLAFDGCRYILTARCGCAAVILDRELCPVETVRTRRDYTALCWDPGREGFWALSGDCKTALFRLDRGAQEVDRLCLDWAADGVAFCCDTGCLLVFSGDALREVDPESGQSALLCRTRGLILSVVCLPPYLLVRVLRRGAVYVLLLSRGGEVLGETRDRMLPGAAALAPDPCTGQLLALTHKHGCYPHLLRLCLREDIAGCLWPCSHWCRECGEDCGDGCEDILRSVAQVECAVAHILHAEGEKLQTAMARCAPPRELLRLNDSVQRTILYVTQLEQVLLAKLEAVRDCGCGGCGETP